MSSHTSPQEAPAGRALAILLDNHRAFLRFLEGRVGDRALAEDILQDAFVRNLQKAEAVPEEALVPWFYRTLRNAAIDQFRRRAVRDRALEALARELESHETPAPDMVGEICACIARLAGTLKPEYADALKAIEVEGVAVKTYAERNGLSTSNAAAVSSAHARRCASVSSSRAAPSPSTAASTAPASPRGARGLDPSELLQMNRGSCRQGRPRLSAAYEAMRPARRSLEGCEAQSRESCTHEAAAARR